MRGKRLLLSGLIITIGLFGFTGCGGEGEAVVEERTAPTYDVSIDVQCDENLFFSRYDVDVSLDYSSLGTVEHGSTEAFTCELEEGEYEIIFENEDDSEVDGKGKFTVKKDSKNEFAYRIHCNSDQIDVEKIEKKPENVEATTEQASTKEQTEKTTKAKAKKGRIDEMAFRAAVVAMTNATAYDVFEKDDGNTHDPSKYHSYADQDGDCIWDVISDGYWKAKGENKWHVRSLKMINEYDVVMTVSLDVKYDGTNYVISNVKGEMHKPGTDLEPTDLAIATDPHYVNNNTSFIVPKSLIDKDR